MAIKTVILLLGFLFFSFGSLYAPMVGVVGYVLHYHFWPESQWYGRDISAWGLRYAFTIGLCLAIGTILNKHKLRIHGPAMRSHEWLLVFFWACAVASIATGLDLSFREHDRLQQAMLVDKITKVLLFCLLMSHVVTTLKRVDILLWAIIIGTLYNGYQAWEAPMWKFTHSRLDGIGGPDFRESSFLGAHFAMVLPLIGIQFLRGSTKAKLLCVLVGGFAVNGLILTRTRAAFLALIVGVVVAILLALRGRRRQIIMYILPGLIVGAYLTDTGFRNRMQTISSDPRVQDKSSSDRLLIWTSALRMFEANPLGVGLGNFQVAVGDYSEELVRRDAHNTYLRCATEEGIFGIIILAAIAVSAFLCLFRSNRIGWRCPYTWQVRYYSYGLAISLSVVLTSAFFMSMLYIEEFWWVLTMPICLLRAAETEFRVTSEAALTAAEALQESDLDLQPLGYGPGVGYELA